MKSRLKAGAPAFRHGAAVLAVASADSESTAVFNCATPVKMGDWWPVYN
jgi:hypothetical protein